MYAQYSARQLTYSELIIVIEMDKSKRESRNAELRDTKT